ncbi:dsRBD fold-containing protein [Mycobacterium angelicum]|uniref:Uncharacterized protein n=1 Tax=Mycobacterium angelicum TaxID=470074 RepID=A0A1W9ZNC8_MYCAN|nr:DUF1876 family protein [Mycobacterium angelicum]ORA19118.1 hypothetical protein BST12_17990 [Mycobacterium angelicum]
MHQNSHRQSVIHPLVTLAIDEHHGRTFAKVELEWGGAHFAGLGVAYRHPADCLTSKTGQELATARAFSHLADQVSTMCRARN